jgi:hypothetical protein
VGPRFIIAPGVFIPSTGSAGFTLGIIGGYGFDLGPLILTPGLIGQGSWSSDWTVYSGLGGLRVTLPLGNFGPYVEAALGTATLTAKDHSATHRWPCCPRGRGLHPVLQPRRSPWDLA